MTSQPTHYNRQLQADVVALELELSELIDVDELEMFRDWDNFTDAEMASYLGSLLNIRVDILMMQ